MTYYKKHAFICTNLREDGRMCCADSGAKELHAYAKDKIKQLEQNGKGKVRINIAGCMDRCAEGPVLVIYPEGTWYRYRTEADIDEIIDQHLMQNKLVQRLLI